VSKLYDYLMRTTLTIDDDIAMKLKSASEEAKDKSFKDIVNETLRRGLFANENSVNTVEFRVRSRKMGVRKGLNYDNIDELLEQIEDSHK